MVNKEKLKKFRENSLVAAEKISKAVKKIGKKELKKFRENSLVAAEKINKATDSILTSGNLFSTEKSYFRKPKAKVPSVSAKKLISQGLGGYRLVRDDPSIRGWFKRKWLEEKEEGVRWLS